MIALLAAAVAGIAVPLIVLTLSEPVEEELRAEADGSGDTSG